MFNNIASPSSPKSFKDFYCGLWVRPIRTAKKYPVAFTLWHTVGTAIAIVAGKQIANAIVADIVRKQPIAHEVTV